MSRPAEVQLVDGASPKYHKGDVYVKASGWVVLRDDEGTVHYPPHMVERVVGDADHQSPHGRI